jgi:hypothetical protein
MSEQDKAVELPEFKNGISRLYCRVFQSAADANEFITTAELVRERVSPVTIRYQVIQSLEDPRTVFEIWSYPDEETMRWVQAAMEGATAVPRKFAPQTTVWTSRIRLDMLITD